MSLPVSVVRALQDVVGTANVICDPAMLAVFERDGSMARGLPDAVVFPLSTEQVVSVVGIAALHHVPIVARGAGSGLSGGAVTVCGGIALQTSLMKRIIHLDPGRRWALVEPGLANGDLNSAAFRHGLFYAPDPSSRRTCTIGGNAAENSGGPRSLLYGVTANHVIGMEVVLADASVHWFGDEGAERLGLDLLGLLIGSEGTLGVITKIKTRLLPLPEATATIATAFDSVAGANSSVTSLLGCGLGPAALEIMDGLTVAAVEGKYQIGYPNGAGAVLITELHGTVTGTREVVAEAESVMRAEGGHGLLIALDDEAEPIWRSRQGAISALARIRPNFYLHDLVVPRTYLPEMVQAAAEIGRECRLPVASTLHAGDGNLHPTLLYDTRQRGDQEAVIEAGEEMLRACVAAGGTLSGEHGIGAEKRDLLGWVHGPHEIEAMAGIKRAFDPAGILNPGKIFPAGIPTAVPVARSGRTDSAQWW